MSSLLNKTASVMHKQHGYFVSDGWKDAPMGSYGTKDADVYEGLDQIKNVDKGVPDPITHSIVRTPRWFLDDGVSTGNWKVGAGVPGGLVSLSVTVEFSSKYSIACFLSSYNEVRMDNTDAVGDALAALYREKGTDWKLNRKWVYAALKVNQGFIVMSQEKDTKVTLSGKGTVNASGVPVTIDVAGFQSGATSSVEFVGLDGISPFVNLAEVYDPIFRKADWRQIG